ncbi:MAG: prephenate dehydrogenase [Segetibacter sp.]|nr:prephenate dehydrogenase [Segetibacter sp.]
MVVAIIGVGLIGGSLALKLKELRIAQHLIGVEQSESNQKIALERQLVDEFLPLEEAIEKADLIILAIPVNSTIAMLQKVITLISKQVVMDVGSTKKEILEAIKGHPNRKRFVATHPMWGTEFSGPTAATADSFANKAAVICSAEESDKDAVEMVEQIYTQLGMHLMYMDAAAHDVHTAYISHISHITSFALANTVLEKEKEENTIFELASGGFESTVRLAKSNPEMWVPIFKQNRENVLDVLNEHISQLRKIKSCLEKENYEYLKELIVHANDIKRILK